MPPRAAKRQISAHARGSQAKKQSLLIEPSESGDDDHEEEEEENEEEERAIITCSVARIIKGQADMSLEFEIPAASIGHN